MARGQLVFDFGDARPARVPGERAKRAEIAKLRQAIVRSPPLFALRHPRAVLYWLHRAPCPLLYRCLNGPIADAYRG